MVNPLLSGAAVITSSNTTWLYVILISRVESKKVIIWGILLKFWYQRIHSTHRFSEQQKLASFINNFNGEIGKYHINTTSIL